MKLKNIPFYLIIFLYTCSASAQNKYAKGIFILNEDWFGKNNSTLNFLNTDKKEFEYRIIQANSENGVSSLGCTAQFGTIYGDNLYVISKQDQDKGEGRLKGGRVVVADAQTMKIKKSIPVIYEINGKSAADGRSFVGVDEKKAYIGTSNGIFIFDLQTFQIKERILGTENPLVSGGEDNANGLGPLYQNQIGIMIRTLDYVFAVQQDKGILVIDPQTDSIIKIIEGCFSTMAQSKDGTIWVGKNSNMEYQAYPYGVFGATGEKWEGNQLLKINPVTWEISIIELPESYGINQTWYAWTAGSLCASAHHNRLYFAFNTDKWSWFTTSTLLMYDIDENSFFQIYDSASEGRYFYGSSIRVNPLDDMLYASLYIDNVNQTYFFYQLDNEGKRLNQYEPIKRYWFPSLFIFPDIYEPEVKEFSPILTDNNKTVRIDLSEMATDKDNMDIAITKKIINVSNKKLKAEIKNNQLLVTPLTTDLKDAIISVRFNSNGKIKDRNLQISFIPPVSLPETNHPTIQVYVHNHNIHIQGIEIEEKVDVLNTYGQLIKSQMVKKEGVISGLAPGQIYMIKIHNKNYKVIL